MNYQLYKKQEAMRKQKDGDDDEDKDDVTYWTD